MRTVTVHLKSESPYSQSAPFIEPKLTDGDGKEIEDDSEYEKRCWRHKMHEKDGIVFIPPMAISFSIQRAAQNMGIKIPGKGAQRYTQKFKSGLLISTLPFIEPQLKVEDVEGQWLFVDSKGRPGGGTRVWKCFPKIDTWETHVEINILDDEIPIKIFESAVREAGKFVGIGRSRPENRGWFGRFRPEQFVWV